MSGENTCAIFFSGGTDSTCVSALMAERFRELHLLTFTRHGISYAEHSQKAAQALRQKFPGTRFVHKIISTNRLFEYTAYHDYLRSLLRYGYYMLSSCTFCSLSWHARMAAYCLDNDIMHAADGITRELLHYGGHMDANLKAAREFYARLGIEYENPVRNWDIPPSTQFINKITQDYDTPQMSDPDKLGRTTGRYLYEHGLMPSPDIKGSRLDQAMQIRCFDFFLYNMMVFWLQLSRKDYGTFEKDMHELYRDKLSQFEELLNEYKKDGPGSRMARLLEK